MDGGTHFALAALEAVVKARQQNLIPLRPRNGKTLLHGHKTQEADGVGGIACSMIRGANIQTPACCHKIIYTPPPRGQRCLSGKWRALVWGNRRLVELGAAVPSVPGATIGHGHDMDMAIQPGLGFGLGPRLPTRLRRQMGRTGALGLLRRPLLRVLVGVGLEVFVSVERARVWAPASKILL